MNAHPPGPLTKPLDNASLVEPGSVPDRQSVRPHVLVLGGGFGGLSTVQALRRVPVDVTVIDQRNHHLFQPLLYQVATAGLSPAQIAGPIRAIVGQFPNVRVLLGQVTGVDAARRQVSVEGTSVRMMSYDTLAVATGARHSYFGHDEWAAFAPGLKTVGDAVSIRRRILLAFERAETVGDAAERDRLLTFVIVGGGPTGVEMAGSVTELARYIITRDFRSIDPTSARVILVEAGPRLLPTFAPDSSSYAEQYLIRLGAQLRLNSLVTGIDAAGVQLGTDRIEARTVVWAAGVEASPAAAWLSAEHDRAGRVKVTDHLTVPGHPEIFVIGDTALILDTKGRPVPGLAPAAKEGGEYVGRAIRMRLQNKNPGSFRYRHYGNLAALGRRSAIIEFGRLHLRGSIAWAL